MSKIASQINKFILILIIGISLAIASYWYWNYQQLHPSTNDAYVQANVVHVAAQVSGPVSQIYVSDHQYVKNGQPLFDIDPAPFQIAVTKAQANLNDTIQQIQAADEAVSAAQAVIAERQAALTEAQKTADRINTLLQEKLVAQASADTAKENLDIAKAQLTAAEKQLQEAIAKRGAPGDANAEIQAAQAALAQAKLDLEHTHIVAKTAGYLVNFDLRVGSMVTADQSQFAIIDDQLWWVQANFKETDLARINNNEPATIKVDMYPNYTFHGYVQSISSGSGASFSILPPENATGNWVKVTQRFPVKVIITDPNPNYPLRMGASSTVTIHVAPDHEKPT